jgi:hypothetical protein
MSTNFSPELHTFHSPKFNSIVEDAIKFLEATPVHPLPPPDRFAGSGVYALYYTGDFYLYEKMAERNRNGGYSIPIYVGKAVPRGWRTGRTATKGESRDLFQRLSKHSRSIKAASATLSIDDFRCRFMILRGIESDLITLVEAELIRRYQPLWNQIIDGFGNNDPGITRYSQLLAEWDTLHQGRVWVGRWTGERPTIEDIEAKVRRFYEQSPLF